MKYKIVLTCFVLLLGVGYQNQAQAICASNYYVATNGNDSTNTGLTEASPFATIEKARDTIRNGGGLPAGGVNVWIREGTYYLTAALAFGASDSGTSTQPITYQAYPGETPVISGGKQITGTWTPIGSNVYTITIPEVANGTWWFRQLWYNGVRCHRSRWPNDGYPLLTITAVSADYKSITFNQTLPAGSLIRKDAELILFLGQNYNADRARISDKYGTAGVTTVSVCGVPQYPDVRPAVGKYGYIEHSPDYIDMDTEWHLQRSTGLLTFKCPAGLTPGNLNFVAGKLSQLVRLMGTDINNTVQYVNFKGLCFQNTEWDLPSFGFPEVQANHYTDPTYLEYVLSPGIEVQYAMNCKLEKCYIANTATIGVGLGAGCRNNQIIDCTLNDIGGTGIMSGWRGSDSGLITKVGPTPDWTLSTDIPQSNLIDNCYLYDTGSQFWGSVGIFDAFSNSTTITNNLLKSLPYTGLSIGFYGTYNANSQQNTYVANNLIRDTMLRMNDGGGIYTYGNCGNAVITDNYVHHVGAGIGTAAYNNAVFLDGYSKYITVANTLAHNIAGSPTYTYREQSVCCNPQNITYSGNHWDLANDQPGSWGTTEAAIAAASGVQPAAPTGLTIALNGDSSAVLVKGTCEPWATINTATVTQDGHSVAAYLSVKTNGQITGTIPMSAIYTGSATLSVTVKGPENNASPAGTSNTLYNLPVQSPLRGWWKMDEGSGTASADSSGNSNTLTLTSTSWTAGILGSYAVNFGGAGYGTSPNTVLGTVTTGVTIAFWQYGDNDQSAIGNPYFSYSGTHVMSIRYPYTGNGTLTWTCGNDWTDAISKMITDATQYKNQWNHWAFTKNTATGTMAIYLNGTLWYSVTGKTRPIQGNTTGEVRIGSYTSGTYPYHGKLDDFRIYNRELSASEVATLAMQNLPTGWWKMDEGSGTTSADFSGYNNALSFVSASWVTGHSGYALSFAGVGHGTVPTASLSKVDKEVTIAFWQYGDTDQSAIGNPYFSYNYGNGHVMSIRYPYTGNTNLTWTCSNDWTDSIAKSLTTDSWYKNAWNHWAFTKNANTGVMAIYHNGSLWYSVTGKTRPIAGSTANEVNIGAYVSGTYPYHGKLDDFRVYPKALTSDQILGIYNGTF
jgi:hypothetical protein